LWKSNTSVAKEFRDTIKTLRPIGPSGTWGDVGRGWQGAKTLGGDLFSRLLGLSTWGNVSLNAIRAFGAGIRAREDAAKRAMGIAGSPKLGPGNEEGEQDWMLLNYQRWIDMMRGPVFGPGNAAGFQELIGIREQRRTNAFSLGRPDQGSLSGIGGFTSAAGILARTEAKTQTEFLKLIEEHTKETAALHRMQAAEAVLE
jgi:hypothetical protein